MSAITTVTQTLRQPAGPEKLSSWAWAAPPPTCIAQPDHSLHNLAFKCAWRFRRISTRHSRLVLRAARRKEEDHYDFLYGVYPVLYALRAGRRRCIKLWLQGEKGPKTLQAKDSGARQEIRELSESLDIDTKSVTRVKLDRMSENRPHQGFILKCRRLVPGTMVDLPSPSPGTLWVAFEGVTDPMNLGAILRSAAFFHASGIIAEHGAARLTAVASKASAGAAETLPLYGTGKLAEMLLRATEKGWKVLGTALPAVEGTSGARGDQDLFETAERWLRGHDLEGGAAVLVLGAEGAGLSSATKAACGALLHIRGGAGPGGLDSLNVSVAAGIALHSVRSALGWPAPKPCGQTTEAGPPSQPVA